MEDLDENMSRSLQYHKVNLNYEMQQLNCKHSLANKQVLCEPW